MFTRRQFIAASCAVAGASVLPGCRRAVTKPSFTGGIRGASAATGHRLREGKFPAASRTVEVDAVVIGGGISGLAAARQLQRNGVHDFLLLEMENRVGGNSLSGRNETTPFPWGAHYLPLPSEESAEVTSLLEELHVITGYTPEGLPLFDDYALCSDPMERLFVNGVWQEGLVPRRDVTAKDRAEIDAFLSEMDILRKARGTDGRRAFAIPVDRSSRDAQFLRLDEITMAAYLDNHGWRAEPLRWYVDYCCRDDYGAGIDQISAWAGIHYFSSRNARAGNAAPSAVLTWPEGNGWLVQKLREPLRHTVHTGALVWSVKLQSDGRVAVDYLDVATNFSVRVIARGAVCALPRFVADRLIHEADFHPSQGLSYSPWLVANVSLSQLPAGAGEPLAWDNVFRKGRSLGYVVATHQDLDSHPQKTVITYYHPLDELPPAESRKAALERSYSSWCDQVLHELARAHPELPASVTQLDIWLWGHAMIRPVPGFIWGETRAKMQANLGPIVFAHSDMSGISIFEEAYTRGTLAARVLTAKLREQTTA